MEKLLKENLSYILIAVILFVAGIYGIWANGGVVINNINDMSSKKAELETKKTTLDMLIAKQKAKETKQDNPNGKVIYEVLGQQFSPEASFGIMFENILSNITNSGVRIRSIDYNYKPTDDKILLANIQGYNACELSFVTVGKYTQIQTFFKNIAKEKYLSSINEVYIEPYDQDRSILIARFKIRLYTKTI